MYSLLKLFNSKEIAFFAKTVKKVLYDDVNFDMITSPLKFLEVIKW